MSTTSVQRLVWMANHGCLTQESLEKCSAPFLYVEKLQVINALAVALATLVDDIGKVGICRKMEFTSAIVNYIKRFHISTVSLEFESPYCSILLSLEGNAACKMLDPRLLPTLGTTVLEHCVPLEQNDYVLWDALARSCLVNKSCHKADVSRLILKRIGESCDDILTNLYMNSLISLFDQCKHIVSIPADAWVRIKTCVLRGEVFGQPAASSNVRLSNALGILEYIDEHRAVELYSVMNRWFTRTKRVCTVPKDNVLTPSSWCQTSESAQTLEKNLKVSPEFSGTQLISEGLLEITARLSERFPHTTAEYLKGLVKIHGTFPVTIMQVLLSNSISPTQLEDVSQYLLAPLLQLASSEESGCCDIRYTNELQYLLDLAEMPARNRLVSSLVLRKYLA